MFFLMMFLMCLAASVFATIQAVDEGGFQWFAAFIIIVLTLTFAICVCSIVANFGFAALLTF